MEKAIEDLERARKRPVIWSRPVACESEEEKGKMLVTI